MPATKISDLLPISDGNVSPHAYEIFGLEAGEQDSAKLAVAVKKTIASLKAVKADTEPQLWRQAAQLVQAARVTLADPQQKAELDARFGIVSISDVPDSTTAGADPLAGILPPTDPLAAVLPAADPMASAQRAGAPVPPVSPVSNPSPPNPTLPDLSPSPGAVMPPGMFGAPVQSAAESMPTAAVPVSPSVSGPVIRKTKPALRRRSALKTLFFSVLMLGMLGLIASAIYFLLYGSGTFAITSKEGEITITTGTRPTGEEPQIDPSRPIDGAAKPQAQPLPFDPVMGRLSPEVPPPAKAVRNNPVPDALSPSPRPPKPAPVKVAQPTPPPQAKPLTAQMIANADAQTDRVRQLIRAANWKQIKPAAETLRRKRMNDQQKAKAEGMYELADLATFYRGAIEKAVADLKIGNEFEVTEGFRVIVVEKGPEKLIIRYNAKNREFTFDQLPLTLAHKLATFALPEGPTRQAAKAAYQAIAPKSTDGHRQEAVDWLRQISGAVEGADPKRVAQTIESVFAGDR